MLKVSTELRINFLPVIVVGFHFSVSVADLKSSEKLEQVVKKLRGSFSRPFLIVENDKANKLLIKTKNNNQPLFPQPQPEWTSGAANTIAKLRQAFIGLLFSDTQGK